VLCHIAPTGSTRGCDVDEDSKLGVREMMSRSRDANDDERVLGTPSTSLVLIGESGTYALLEVIGRGAYGTVYKGIWREVGRHVAIKRVVRARLSSDEEKALQAEIDLFKHLKHRHIVNYVEAVEMPGSEFLDIVMEFVEGGSLYSIVQSIRRSQRRSPERRDNNSLEQASAHVFSEAVVASFIAQVIHGLCYLHGQGVVHRDIKGANILVTKSSEVKLADFGVASTKRGSELGASSNMLDVAGTPYWMAPEIISLEGCSTASDIWSVGCTVIELLTGFPPYHHLSDVTALFRIVQDECPPFPDNISPECQQFLRSCFNKDVNARATAEQLLDHVWMRRNGAVSAVDNAKSSESTAVDSIGASAGNDSRREISEDDDLVCAGDLNQYEEGDDEGFDEFEFEHDAPGNLSSQASPSEKNHDVDMDGISALRSGGGDLSRISGALATDEDPFRDVMADPEADRETDRLRRHKEIWQRVKLQASLLGTSADSHVTACDNLLSIFAAHPEQRFSLIYDPGLLPVLEVLEGSSDGAPENQRIAESMLRVTVCLLDGRMDELARSKVAEYSSPTSADGHVANALRTKMLFSERNIGALDDLDSDETYLGYPRVSNIRLDLCLAGFLPAIMRYCDRAQPIECRLLAGRFVEEMLHLESTLHMLVACRGFTVFVDMLEPNIDKLEGLAATALRGIEKLLSMEKQRHKRDFCRRFAWCGLLDRIVQGIEFCVKRLESLSLLPLAENECSREARYEEHVGKLARLLQTFAARADPTVKAKMITPDVLSPIVRHIVSRHVPEVAVEYILCAVRDLSRDPQTHASLEQAAAIDVLVQYLSGSSRRTDDTKTRHYIISCIHNLCIVSPRRQEIAVVAGLVPHLQSYIRSNDMNLRSLCIDIYSGLACSGHTVRVQLSNHSGVDFYVELLTKLSVPGTVRKWQARVLQSLSEWLEDELESKHVEYRLNLPRNCGQVCQALSIMRVKDAEAVLEPYWRIVTCSEKVNRALGASCELLSAMVQWLEQMYGPTGAAGGPRGRLLLLRILIVHARVWTPETSHAGLVAALRVLLTERVLEVDEAITVREQAAKLVAILDGRAE
jgi:serine/threonine protein kinase